MSKPAKEPETFIFTSDLSVDEFLLTQEAGFEPRGLVVGSSIFNIGFQQVQPTENHEMILLTQALQHARELAIKRMLEEAHALDADGVVGVRLTLKHLEFNQNFAEFVAIGTAIKDPTVNWRVNSMPFSSTLSGQEFYSLIHSGYRPLGLVLGNCIYHVGQQTASGWMKTVGRNTEMSMYTEALYDAREVAMEKLTRDATKLGADGVVDVRVKEGTYGENQNLIEFFFVGTAIAEAQSKHFLPKPQLVMSLDDTRNLGDIPVGDFEKKSAWKKNERSEKRNQTETERNRADDFREDIEL